MKKRNRHGMIAPRWFAGALSLLILVSATGCGTLKKKFIRQKKKDKQSEDFIPVLDPIDYGERIYSSEERYKQHYNLWQVWHKELTGAMTDGESSKRELYFLDQMLLELQEMRNFIKQEKQAELQKWINKTAAAKERFEKPQPMQNRSSMRRQVDSIAKQIRIHFTPKVMKDYYR